MILTKPLVLTLLAGTLGAAPAAEPQKSGVTLITGDRVIVTGGTHRVEPGPGRRVEFSSQVRGGHLFVIPSDAVRPLADGVLDRRLFDVTQLLAWGYGDAATPDIPVISQGATIPGVRQAKQLSGIGMTPARVPKASAARTWKDLTRARTLKSGTSKLWLDGRRSWTLDQSVKQIGAPQAWQQGLTGKDVTVAVLDSGYDPDHPDFKDAVAQARNFSSEPDVRDDFGHGTHVASTVAGRGEKYRGVAPEAKLAIGKVGGRAGPTDSAILAGMEWAALEVKAKVVNMSFGDVDGPDLDPLEQAVNTLSERTGTLFVAGAGNSGGKGTVISPSTADAALSVGAVDKQGKMAGFSSPGPRVTDHAIKPEVVAPGVEIVAAAASGTADGSHVAMSGTSMATPHVTGAAAILAQQHPDWTGAQLKAALIGSAAPVKEATLYHQGAGLIDLTGAVKQQVVASPGQVWAAFPWNDTAGRTTTKTITYTNTGDTPLTLDLSADGEVLKPAAERVEVPAKGQATVTLTIDAEGKAPGDYPGTITARSGETVVRTLAGAYVEPESYDVTVTVLGVDGKPANPFDHALYDARTGEVHQLAFRDGVGRIRVREGDWNFFAEIWERDAQGRFVKTTAAPALKVDGGDQQLTVDARQGRPVRVGVDDPAAVLDRGYGVGLRHGAWNIQYFSSGTPNDGVHVIPSRQEGLTYTLTSRMISKDVKPSPFVYQLVDRRTGGLPEDPVYDAKRKDLAKITATFRASGSAGTGTPLSGARFDDLPGGSMGSLVGEIALPGTLTMYRTPGLTYESGLEVGTSMTVDGGRLAKRGETSEVWNAAVTGPSFLLPTGSRTGDTLAFPAMNLFADGASGGLGTDFAATGTATLTRGGQVLAKTDLADCELFAPRACELRADLPAERASYTLTASMRRPEAALSTSVESVWTFPSGTTPKAQPLPLAAVRFSPAGLDTFNRAEPGTTTRLPIRIERNTGQNPPTALNLEMSVNDGTSWQRVPVVRTGKGWTALIPNPRTAGHVSLRAAVNEPGGVAVRQTVIRAYPVG